MGRPGSGHIDSHGTTYVPLSARCAMRSRQTKAQMWSECRAQSCMGSCGGANLFSNITAGIHNQWATCEGTWAVASSPL
eukprot:3274612-Alexandrium_andersonii.AAC.1